MSNDRDSFGEVIGSLIVFGALSFVLGRLAPEPRPRPAGQPPAVRRPPVRDTNRSGLVPVEDLNAGMTLALPPGTKHAWRDEIIVSSYLDGREIECWNCGKPFHANRFNTVLATYVEQPQHGHTRHYCPGPACYNAAQPLHGCYCLESSDLVLAALFTENYPRVAFSGGARDSVVKRLSEDAGCPCGARPASDTQIALHTAAMRDLDTAREVAQLQQLLDLPAAERTSE